jgi:pilus assembly protein Flp/PilA
MLRVHGPMGRLAQDQRGATSIEYGLVAMLVAVAMLVGLRALSESNSSSWNDTSNKITSAMKESGK